MIDQLYNFAVAHPFLFLTIWTAIWNGFYFVFSAYVGSLRAPTAQSTQNYCSYFAVMNAIAGNLHRMNPPQVENSPNWQAAVQKYIAANGGAK